MLKSVRSVFRSRGLRGVIDAAVRRLRQRRAGCLPLALSGVSGRQGLEIGGPSSIFSASGLLPLYPAAATLDNCNFGSQTIWEGALRPGQTFVFDPSRGPGIQWLAEAVDLSGVENGRYDFVLSSHTLEHLANPIRALVEWRRVLKPEGTLLLILPDPHTTFDHKRPLTTLAHLREDFAHGIGEDDMTHLAEVLALHDLDRDPDAGGRAQFEKRCRENLQYRSMHHHTFDARLIADLLGEAGFDVLASEAARPHHLITVARARDRRHTPPPLIRAEVEAASKG